MDKVTKFMAVYVQPNGFGGSAYPGDPDGNYFCATCRYYAPASRRCTVVTGDIAPNGGCVFWYRGSPLSEASFKTVVNPARVDQAWAYEVQPKGFSCKRCEYFNPDAPPGQENCKRVMGRVQPDGCCDLWEKD